ncbi:MAG TPA: GNAT family N-acetyltransferase [Candidatus Binatia bacterium]|nr:GNAT family N-acetyltransferase [Candidatus Binatia bacterium]
MRKVEIREADLADPAVGRAVVELIDEYAREALHGGTPLPAAVREALALRLASHPTTVVFLAFRDARAVGVAVCFRGFSTWNARPLLNVHDLAVTREMRGYGIGRQLLAAVEERARSLGCCKLTLEVRGDNRVAQGLYRSFGFRGGAGAPGESLGGFAGQTFFWEKPLP